MEKDQFVAVETEPWWLLERDVEYRIEESRRRLGASFGWSDPTWYIQREELVEVYDFILIQPIVLLGELELAVDDERRLRWLDSLVELKTPATEEPVVSAPSAAASASATREASPHRSAFGSRAEAPSGRRTSKR
jgi:hypothetical protein